MGKFEYEVAMSLWQATMSRILSGKTALITGGSRGIGRALAEAYARQGARVFICGRDEKNLRAAVDEVRKSGGEIEGFAGDVGNQEDVQRIVSAAMGHYGAIHILVNNASMLGPRETIANYPPAPWEEVLRVNLTGAFLMIRAVLPTMLAQRAGSIINVTSGVGSPGQSTLGRLCGLEGWTRSADPSTGR